MKTNYVTTGGFRQLWENLLGPVAYTGPWRFLWTGFFIKSPRQRTTEVIEETP